MSAAVDRLVFASECVTIGAFRCAIDHPSFRDSGPIQQDCFVFPRTAVVIQHCDGRPFVADPTIVTLYNRNQHYARRPVSADGDRCAWFAVSNDILRGALLRRDPAAANDERPIRFAHAPADAGTRHRRRGRRRHNRPADYVRMEPHPWISFRTHIRHLQWCDSFGVESTAAGRWPPLKRLRQQHGRAFAAHSTRRAAPQPVRTALWI